jgi:hypothetical protein
MTPEPDQSSSMTFPTVTQTQVDSLVVCAMTPRSSQDWSAVDNCERWRTATDASRPSLRRDEGEMEHVRREMVS